MRRDWNQKGKRRRWKPKWFRTGWKACTPCKGRSKIPEGKAKRQEKKVKKFRARSGKQQDYVREASDMDQEEGEEISFVPSAISFPQKPFFRCDNQCSEKTLSIWQLASVVIQEGEHNQFMPEVLQPVSESKRRRTIDKIAVA